jgi:curved DNA-binding protein CbpA
MNEAKSQMGSGEFAKWVERNFSITVRQALFYMAFTKTDTANHFSSMRDFRSRGLGHNVGTVAKKDWHEPVKESIERAKREAARIEEENLSRKREREEKIKLCLRMLDIGYKILSKELHPDKGGSRDAMARLNEARNYAKAALA